MLELFKKKKYYYVPKCPSCRSRVTGRYIKRPKYEVDAIYLERSSLEHGEIIRFADYDIINNCYCESCGYEWYHNILGMLISRERYYEESNVRRAKERLIAFNKEHPKKRGALKRFLAILPKY